ncbi:hypothetical protein GX50_04796 [[Emmonsia] crescens]|uniref:F-box domain-containing protein n=1 Tax=[Emmonsia] crescens TaxID=73230 RepID=A0A2B7ZGE4_9EURO|nr:hypothetical protein GX50_04796 [Emmonsia crescens]
MYEDIPQIILDSLGRHQAKPMLHVVDENCIQLDRLCGSKCLEALDFRLHSDLIGPRMTKEPVLAAQEVVMSCPNLRSLTLSIHTHHGGCVLSPLDDVLTQFSTKLKGKFPPLEELKLDDYYISDEEWPYWSDNLQWQCLWNLSLMSSSIEPILPKLIGRVQNLRKLELMRYPDQIEYPGQFDDNVDKFLRSFSSLEIIIFEGYSASVEALMGHRNLSDLHMHTAESRYSGEIRPVLSAEDLQLLSQNCPKIKDLYIDVYRNGSWPYEIFVALGRGFPYLENLFVHFELGICDTSAPIQPVLKHESAKRLFRRFWVEKKTNLLAQFSSLTFIVGQIRPRFSIWSRTHAVWEHKSAADIQIRPKMNNRPAPKRPKTRSKKSYSDLSKPLFSAQGHRVYWHSPECTIFAGGRVVTDTADGADLELYRMDLNYDVFEKGTCPEAAGRYHGSVLAGLDGVQADNEADNVVAVRPIGRLPSEPSDPSD